MFGAEEFGLEVIALRPRFVTGAGDTSIFPRLLHMQRKKRLSIVGNGLNKVDFTSVHNLNQALISSLLADRSALGKAYNISNGTPVPLWDAVNYVMRRMQLPQVTRYRSSGWPIRQPRSTRLRACCGRAARNNLVALGDAGHEQGFHHGYQPRPALSGLRPASQPVGGTG